jgi:hypothetical protein
MIDPLYYTEFDTESGKDVDMDKLVVPTRQPDGSFTISDDDFSAIHRNTIIPTADALIRYGGGLLLMRRKDKPLQGELCFAGGRIQRGVPLEQSLRQQVKSETGLDFRGLTLLHHGRTLMREDPLGHGKGTDTAGPVFLGVSKGDVKLDKDHDSVMIVRHDNYGSIRDGLAPIARRAMDSALNELEIASGLRINFSDYILRNSRGETPIIS